MTDSNFDMIMRRVFTKDQDERPSKEWWDKCDAHVRRQMPNYTDEQVSGTCGFLWHSGRRPSFDSMNPHQKTKVVQKDGQNWQVTQVNDQDVQYTQLEYLMSDKTKRVQTIDQVLIQDKYKYTKTKDLFIVDVTISKEGVYPYPERARHEAKLAEDLKAGARVAYAIQGFDRHPADGERSLHTYLGHVQNITFDVRKHAIIGRDVIWRELAEHYVRFHDALQRKKPFAVSVGQYNNSGPSGILNDAPYGASQVNILLDHLAHLTDGSIPRCALPRCGINVDNLANDSLTVLSNLLKAETKKLCPLKSAEDLELIHKLIRS